MQNKLKLAVIALCYTSLAFAQNTNTEQNTAKTMDESAFTFTEAQLGEDDNMSQNITILNSNTNAYASEVGFRFSPMRFRFRALGQKHNDIYINGASMNDMESGQFRYSDVGGLNRFIRNVDFALPFESNNFSMTGMAGSNNYDLRAGSMQAGHYAAVAAANRNYMLRGMYTYASGFNKKGWAITAGITYRWANRGYVEGTFYNSLSYYFGVQKKWDAGHSLSFATWGNPTERSTQGASTDEAYWLANDYQYNPYWGYQNGHRRNSRVINDYTPAALLTWDWEINEHSKLTTTLLGKYGMYKSTKLNYNGSDNPQPDYWRNLPSSYYDVWDENNSRYRTPQAIADWNTAVAWWQNKANRQINWDRLYHANQQLKAQGKDLMYYIQAKHSDNLMLNLASTFTTHFGKDKVFNLGFLAGQNKGRHYQTMDDMLGGGSFHNINSYAIGTYSLSDPRVQYDLNTMGPNRLGKLVYEGDKFGYDYELTVRKGILWSSYAENIGNLHYTIAAKVGYDNMYRNGFMRNGMFAEFSEGKSKKSSFFSGGVKFGANYDFGHGHVIMLGLGYEHRAPQANTAFVSPEMNNEFVNNLHSERLFSSEVGYQFKNSWFNANLNAYYNRMTNVTEWQNFYFDDINSFSYVSMTNIKKAYYGLEGGMKFKLASFLELTALGTISEGKYINNADVRYLNSTSAKYTDELLYNRGMRESSTPLTATSIGMSFHQKGWNIELNGNWYDRIYLAYSPSYRYKSSLINGGFVDNDGGIITPPQAKGHGGWMLDGSIGKSVRLKHGQLYFYLMVTNILNNQSIVSGGYEQSRSDYTLRNNGSTSYRAYKFSRNPKKYYMFGTNGMFQVSYRF